MIILHRQNSLAVQFGGFFYLFFFSVLGGTVVGPAAVVVDAFSVLQKQQSQRLHVQQLKQHMQGPQLLSRSSCSSFAPTTTTNSIILSLSQVSQYDADDDDPDEFNVAHKLKYPKPRFVDERLLGDLTGGRPGAIIETEEQLALKEQILQEIESGKRVYGSSSTTKKGRKKKSNADDDDGQGIDLADFGESLEDEEADYDIDDPDAIDAGTLGIPTIQDIRSKYEYEWDPSDPQQIDPNYKALNQENMRYIPHTPKDDEGVEIGYNPIFGPSHPMDQRTILGAKDSFMIDSQTRDESMLTPLFPNSNDPEIQYNEEIGLFRKSLDIIETYQDEFLDMAAKEGGAASDVPSSSSSRSSPKSSAQFFPIPRHVAKWHGYPDQTFFEPKPYENNRFTPNKTNFTALTPFRARQKAVELARAKNAEWLPDGVSQKWHAQQRAPYLKYNTLVGSLRRKEENAEEEEDYQEIVHRIQPALQVLGSCVELLSIDKVPLGADNDGDIPTTNSLIFRFHYHGLMKNKHGMKAWTQTMLDDCLAASTSSSSKSATDEEDDDDETEGEELQRWKTSSNYKQYQVTGVIFETGFRRRDPPYDGGDPYYGIITAPAVSSSS